MKLLPLLAFLACAAAASAQMVSGEKMGHFREAFGLPATDPAFEVTLVASEPAGNVLFPGEQPKLTLLVANHSDHAIEGPAKIEVVRYGTRGLPDDVWKPQVAALSPTVAIPVQVSIPTNERQMLEVQPTIDEPFGGYAIILDLGPAGRRFATTCARTFQPSPQKLQFPKLSLDAPVGLEVLQRLGVEAVRMEIGYVDSKDRDYAAKMRDLEQKLRQFEAANITVLATLGAGGPQPLGRGRPHLSPEGVMLKTKQDLAWLPSADPDFQGFVTRLCATYGWPKGPITAVQLWNEPWEGISISGWGADSLRYREIFTAMATGVEAARAQGAAVLLAGCDSSSNTLDKLFPDGNDAFLPWLDVCTIHYMGPASPRIFKSWAERQSPRGRVQIWDTESWVANSDDRVAPVIAGDRAFGYDRTMGVFYGNISLETKKRVTLPDGATKPIENHAAWSTAAAVGAVQHFIGQREFQEMVFQNGLPWVMRFDGLDGNRDDGTLVVTGDLGASFGKEKLLFRSVDFAKDAKMELPDKGGEFLLYDAYGNAIPPIKRPAPPTPDANGQPRPEPPPLLVIPLTSNGYFLRTNGAPGSMDRLIAAVRKAGLRGIEPVEIIAHDLLSPASGQTDLHLTLTNVLNRPITGHLSGKLDEAGLQSESLTLKPNETREVILPLQNLAARPDNTYALEVEFSGSRPLVHHSENLHVNLIAHRTIEVDGNLEDWRDALPQTVRAGKDQGPSAMEAAWLPFAKYDAAQKGGLATAWLAADNQYLYLAAKIAAPEPTVGALRFAERDEDASFYPLRSYGTEGEKAELLWPPGVRRYSYRERPPLPFGSAPKFDNLQIAFNVIPEDKKSAMYLNPPGTPPRFTAYQDTDYEYALNPVADEHGGGTEIWRCLVPGMVRKHFYPHQPASSFDGPVTNGKLLITQEGNTRIIEAALPWSEIPLVKQARDAGRTIKFSYRVNSPAAPGMELAEGRSVSRQNLYAFHPDWVEHWANEVEFAFEK